MTQIKKIVNTVNVQLLGAVAALAVITAAASVSNLCCYWFHQPKMPDSVRFMKK